MGYCKVISVAFPTVHDAILRQHTRLTLAFLLLSLMEVCCLMLVSLHGSDSAKFRANTMVTWLSVTDEGRSVREM